jgi:predicted Fe-Mo cluster-binding NifX family protein
MRIAVTSQNLRTVTGHAGLNRRFMVWEAEPGAEPVRAEDIEIPKELAFHNFHGTDPHPVDGVDVLITGGCGDGFIRRLAARGVTVLRTSESDPEAAVRAYLSGTLPETAEAC